MGINDFEDSRIWQAAVNLAVDIYSLCDILPSDEKFALISQLKRASFSVSTNIAEGFGRTGTKEKLQFYNIAYGSLIEVKSLILVSVRLGFLKEVELGTIFSSIVRLQKQLNATKSAVKSRL